MDEFLDHFQRTFSRDIDDDTKTNHESLYKNRGKLGNQEERRRKILDVQRSNRYKKLDKSRGILDLVKSVEEDHIFKTTDKAYYRPKIYVAGFNKTSPTYDDVLMMSEWMIEKPKDFHENWYVVPCPMGVRMLVVANQGTTKCFSKYGQFRFEYRTALPGGNPCGSYKNRCCVLDCFYQKSNNIMYVLDLLAWNNQPMTDGETEFRHYWLQTQLAVLQDIYKISKMNEVIFQVLPKVPCTPGEFNKFMMKYPHFSGDVPALDGLLFYHKAAHYVSGETPLVGWLYPYMVPEVLVPCVTINKIYLLIKPKTYANQAEFIQNFEAKMAKKRKGRSRKTSTDSMDTTKSGKNETPREELPGISDTMEAEDTGAEEYKGKLNDSMESEATATGTYYHKAGVNN